MLRFKDHQWLSIGHLHPRFAETVAVAPEGGLRFAGTTLYGTTPVAWSVRIGPDPGGLGFDIDCAIEPAATIELLEAFSAFETPYVYDGRETVVTVIGMNPVSKWRGNQRLTPPVWENPAWVYGRPQAARMTAPSSAPYLFQAITDATCGVDRHLTLVGDWQVCRVHDLHAHPTRDTPQDPDSLFHRAAELKGFKYLVGALNWSSAYAKDPNVLFEGGVVHRQRLLVEAGRDLPGGHLEAALLRAWERAASLGLPGDGRVAAAERAAGRGVSWAAAGSWLREVFVSRQTTEDLFQPGAGICTYAKGSRPKAGDHYTWSWWPQWAGPLHYRALLTGDQELEQACLRHDQDFAEHCRSVDYFRTPGIANKVSSLPTLQWIAGGGQGGILHGALRQMLVDSCAHSTAENGQPRAYDYGAQASLAEALLHGYRAYGDAAMRDQAMVLLEEIAAHLDGNFWEFNVGTRGSSTHGGQIRSLGHGHAVLANLLAHELAGDGRWLEQAHRFARYLLAVNYATHNGSADPDFDWRGWCNGSNAGRDQIAEFPPWETQNGLLCIAALMSRIDLEDGFHNALWYIARTGLAQFPAARTVKRILDQEMRVHYLPRQQIASERDFYDRWPYLAYENPHDQTLLASYQGTDCVVGELVYGGGLARAADARLGVLVPDAARLAVAVANERQIHLWNPLATPLATTVEASWPDGRTSHHPVEVGGRQRQKLVVHRPS